MSNQSNRKVRTQTLTFNSQPHNDWGTVQALDYLGRGGLLARSVLRGPATSTVTEVTLLVFRGAYTADPSTVPDENKVFERTEISVAGSATDADDDYNILLEKAGAPYDTQSLQDATDDDADSTLWAAILGTDGSAADDGVVWSLTAVDVV